MVGYSDPNMCINQSEPAYDTCYLLTMHGLQLRQVTIAACSNFLDIMLGIPPTEDISLLIAAMKQTDEPGEEWTMQREEWVAQLVEHCQHLLVNEGEVCLGGWALVEPFIRYKYMCVKAWKNGETLFRCNVSRTWLNEETFFENRLLAV